MIETKFTQTGKIEINPDLSDAMLECSMVMHEGILQNLDAGGSPTWRALAGGGASHLGGRSGSIGQSIWHSSTDTTASAGGGGLPYSYIHNYGGEIPVTERSRNFFYAMYKDTGDKMWFAMYLKYRVGDRIEMPKREYVTFTDEMVEQIMEKISENIILTKDGVVQNV